MEALIENYTQILKGIRVDQFAQGADDKYSGVFLPLPFEEYWSAKLKVMLVGRETAGWNTANGLNTMQRAAGLGGATLAQVVDEAVLRYRGHLKLDGSKVIAISRSRFKQYYFRLAKELGLDPRALIYANVFAWDYDRQSPRARPPGELQEVASVSKQLLAAQIKHFKPDVIVFAAGVRGIDPMLRELFNEHFDSYVNVDVNSGKLWEFKAANATCFRIAHPRATNGHGEFRDLVIERIKSRLV